MTSKRTSLLALPAVALLALLAGCDDTTSTPVADPGKAGDVYVIGQKYGGGGSSSLDRIRDGALSSVALAKIPAHSNTGIAADGGIVFFLDKTLGVVTGFANGDPSNVVLDLNVGASSNPYDVAVLSGKAWIARYESASLLAVDLATGKASDSIDLSSYGNGKAPVPNMMAVVRWNSKLVVPVQRQDADFIAADTSLVLIIDPTTRKVEQRIALPFGNVYDVDLRGDFLALGCIGGWDSNTNGGLAIVNLATATVTKSIPATVLEGDPTTVAFTADDVVWTTIDQSYPNSRARSVTLSTSKPGALFEAASAAADVAFDGRDVWVANGSDANPIVYRIDPATSKSTLELRATLAARGLLVLK